MTPIGRVEQRMKDMSWEEAEDVGVEILARCLALHMYVHKDEEKYIDHLLTRILERGTEWAKENALGLGMASVGLKLKQEANNEDT